MINLFNKTISPHHLKLHFRRFEFKYLLTYNQYRLVKAVVARRLEIDPFTDHSGSYIIESLYLDSPNFNSYLATKAGIKNRRKFRLRRYYFTHPHESKYVFWEIKRKDDITVFKDRTPLSPFVSQKLLRPPIDLYSKNEILQKFIAAKAHYLLKPKILIRYRREPFLGTTPEIRLTFDHDISAVRSSDWNWRSEGSSVIPGLVVMECKYTSSLPLWLGQLIGTYNLERLPVSKYCLSLEKTTNNLSWVTQ